MKKFKFLVFILLSLTMSIFAFATEENYTSKAPWQYGEMENGLFVRTMEEEMSWINEDDPDYEIEWNLCKESRYLDELTPEMKELGYMLYNGNVLYPEGEPSEAESTIIVNGSKAQENMTTSGQVTFQGVIDSDINEICFIEVKNTTTGIAYLVNLYSENSYSRTVEFPEGDYIVLSGGIYNDYTSEYAFESENFVVKNGSSSFIVVKVGYSDSEKESAKETEESLENKTPDTLTDYIVDEEPQPLEITEKTSKSLILSIIQPVCIMFLAFIIFKIYTRKKNEDD